MVEPSSPPPVTSPSLATTPPPPPSPPNSQLSPPVDLNLDRDDGGNDINQCCCNELICHNGHNFGLSDVPVRIMFYLKKCWQDFKGEYLESLCSGFADGKTLLPLKIEGVMYAFDFLRMMQIHLCSGNQRSIAWIDKKGKHFFPIRFIDHDFSQCPLNSRIVQIGVDKKGKRKIQPTEVAVSDVGLGGTKQESLFPNANLLSKNDKTYMYTSSLLLSNIAKVDPRVVVTNIHEFQISESLGRSRWAAFEKHIAIAEAARGKANVVYAWYAAPAEKVASIFSHGFELPPNPPALRPSIGAGIFLANLESPQYSGMQYRVDKDLEKHLILCRVVLGSVEKVELEFNQTSASRKEFDTGSDDPNNPKWYVVWANDMNRRILPVCILSCKTSAILSVSRTMYLRSWRNLGRPISIGWPRKRECVVKSTVANPDSNLILCLFTVEWKKFAIEVSINPWLILEIKKRIPIANVPALHDIYDSLKKQRVTKEIFKKQIRAIAGDQLLFQIAKEIRLRLKMETTLKDRIEHN